MVSIATCPAPGHEGQKMRRLYVRGAGGKGFDPLGWVCPDQHILLDEGKAGAGVVGPPPPPESEEYGMASSGTDARDFEIKRLEKEATGLERQLTERAEVITKLEGELESSRADLPSLARVIEHCEGGSCTTHAKDWGELKTRIVQAAFEAMPEDAVRARAEALNLIPKRIVIRQEA